MDFFQFYFTDHLIETSGKQRCTAQRTVGQFDTPAENSALLSESSQLEEVPRAGEVIIKQG